MRLRQPGPEQPKEAEAAALKDQLKVELKLELTDLIQQLSRLEANTDLYIFGLDLKEEHVRYLPYSAPAGPFNYAQFLCLTGELKPLQNQLLNPENELNIKKLLESKFNDIFLWAVKNNKKVRDFLIRLITDLEPTNDAQRYCIIGCLNALRTLKLEDKSRLTTMIEENNYAAYRWALEFGHFDIANYIEKNDLIPKSKIKELIEKNFHLFAKKGHLPALAYACSSLKKEDALSMILNPDNRIFDTIFDCKNQPVIEFIADFIFRNTSPERTKTILEDAITKFKNLGFLFSESGMGMLKFMEKWTPDLLLELIRKNDYKSFDDAAHLNYEKFTIFKFLMEFIEKKGKPNEIGEIMQIKKDIFNSLIELLKGSENYDNIASIFLFLKYKPELYRNLNPTQKLKINHYVPTKAESDDPCIYAKRLIGDLRERFESENANKETKDEQRLVNKNKLVRLGFFSKTMRHMLRTHDTKDAKQYIKDFEEGKEEFTGYRPSFYNNLTNRELCTLEFIKDEFNHSNIAATLKR